MSEIRSATFSVEMRKKELDQFLANPEEAGLDLEEENEAIGLTPEEKAESKSILSEEHFQHELEVALRLRNDVVAQLNELAEGSYDRIIEFLQRNLDAQEYVDRLFRESRPNLSPAYREKQDAKTRALKTYIEVLTKKKAT